MHPAANLGRDRNRVKFNVWGFYLKGEGSEVKKTLNTLKAAAETHKARVPGGTQALVLQKVSRKVQVTWPRPVTADACSRILRNALGKKWRDLVTDPAGVQGADQKAATVKEELSSQTAEDAGSTDLPQRESTAQEPKLVAATWATRSRPHLLSLKLEVAIGLYKDKHGSYYEELQQLYKVNWEAELGEGTYGRVYIGTTRSADQDGADKDAAGRGCTSFAIKMLRGKDTETRKTRADAVSAAEEEVRRHAVLGLHPNIVKLVDVGVFWEPQGRHGCNSRSAHLGLVCDMYEIDVYRFLKKSFFTRGGMRHVLNSVLDGLRFIHSRGCIHSDLKPANIFMRGAIHLRGCFLREWFKLQKPGETLHHGKTEFQYQIPSSFEVGKGRGCRNFD